jgi:hypothetical protein
MGEAESFSGQTPALAMHGALPSAEIPLFLTPYPAMDKDSSSQ